MMQFPRLPLLGLAILSLLMLAMPHIAYGTHRTTFAIGGDPRVDPSKFRITTFTGGLDDPLSMQSLSDGSLLVTTRPGQLLRFVDANKDGLADGPGQVLFSGLSGLPTSVRLAGDLVLVNTARIANRAGRGAISVLRQGATPADPYTEIGTIEFDYRGTNNFRHVSHTLAVRPSVGQLGSFDVFFNVGAAGNRRASDPNKKVILDGLLSGEVVADAIHMFTIDNTGPTPTFGGLTQIASGLRNPGGIIFDPANGDLLFSENGVDGADGGNEPVNADELNRIAAADIGGSIENFGFPNRYVEYRTGNIIDDGQGDPNSIDPLAAFTPLPNPADGAESEGPNDIAFAPELFPDGLNRGVFIGFYGKFNVFGADNEENPVVYLDLDTGEYFPFIDVLQPGIGHLVGLLSTSDSLFLADLSPGTRGKIYQIQAIIPEPPSLLMALLGVVGLLAVRPANPFRCFI